MSTIHDEVKEKVEMAIYIAEDGAFHTAAKRLREAAEIYQKLANEISKEMEQIKTK